VAQALLDVWHMSTRLTVLSALSLVLCAACTAGVGEPGPSGPDGTDDESSKTAQSTQTAAASAADKGASAAQTPSANAGAAESCEKYATRECLTDSGQEGRQFCSAGAWDECRMQTYGTPIVLSFAGEQVDFHHETNAAFDVMGMNASVATHWPTAVTPWLVRDLDGNGGIDDGRELFGSMTRLSNGARAQNGFQALAELDADGDGWITAADPAWSTLKVWRDADHDRVSSADELKPLSAYGVVGIAVTYRSETICDSDGNCGIERGAMRFERDGQLMTGSAIDVHLPARR
jgi:hypothetical protein